MNLPSPQEIISLFPGPNNISDKRNAATAILNGEDPRLALIVGPCSIHDPDAALDYAKKLAELQKRLSHCFLIMRVFIEKPRTTIGWKGLVYDPFLDQSNELIPGIEICRKLLCAIAQLDLPIATEFLDPLLTPYFEDLITWGFIGARTCSSQIHRQLASRLSLPIGFKNDVDGNIDRAIEGIITARSPHTFPAINLSGQLRRITSRGNANAHLVLRGSDKETNYDPLTLSFALQKLSAAHLSESLIIDCAHGNSKKDPERQKHTFISILEQKNRAIRGLMLESFLLEGKQQSAINFGQSITDPCLDWQTTEALILYAEEIHSTLSISS